MDEQINDQANRRLSHLGRRQGGREAAGKEERDVRSSRVDAQSSRKYLSVTSRLLFPSACNSSPKVVSLVSRLPPALCFPLIHVAYSPCSSYPAYESQLRSQR